MCNQLGRKLTVFSTAAFESLSRIDSKFPFNKYLLLPEHLVANGILKSEQIITQYEPVTREQLELVHCPHYISRYIDGTIDEKELRRIGVKWTPEAVRRALHAIGASCHAAKLSLQDGASASLAGGQHHAHYDFGSGYSIFNDVVVAPEVLKKQNLIKSWISIDLDIHQGDGTATITRNWPHVFTFSMHAQKVFPLRKSTSSLDVTLHSGMQDQEYLSLLDHHLNNLHYRVKNGQLLFDLIMYQSGVDIMAGDDLGCLEISLEGCKKRDEMVVEFSKRCGGVPICSTLGGGYPNPKIHDVKKSGLERIIQAHGNTIQALKSI
jgi:acetoin utilization deacetylase AcuC-like enzyme